MGSENETPKTGEALIELPAPTPQPAAPPPSQAIPITFRGDRPAEPQPGDAYFVDATKRDDGAWETLGRVLSTDYDRFAPANKPIVVMLPGGFELPIHAAFWLNGDNPARRGWTVFIEGPPAVGSVLRVSMSPSVVIPEVYVGNIRDGFIGCDTEKGNFAEGICGDCGLPLRGFTTKFLVERPGGETIVLDVHELCAVRADLAQVQAQRSGILTDLAAVLSKLGGQARIHDIDLAGGARALAEGPIQKLIEPGGFCTLKLASRRVVAASAADLRKLNGRQPGA